MRAALLLVAACSSSPETGWDAVRNPVLGYTDVAVKDAFMRRADDGTLHFGYSEIQADPFRFRLGFATSADLRTIMRGMTLDQLDTGGLASPDVVRAPVGRYVMTYNSHTRDVGDSANKLYFRTSDDLVTWSAPQRIVVLGADAATDRLIDAALAFSDAGVFVVFKRDQTANIAHAPTLDGPFTLLGELSPGNLENCQLLRIDGVWHLLGTKLPLVHAPVLHRLDGDPLDPAAWRTWTIVREFELPAQRWNSGPVLDHERANAAYLVDERATDGYFYLLYAGSTELDSFERRGHSQLGLARSTDLVTWDAARDR